MNFRTILKNTIREAQKMFPKANISNGVSDWFARNEFVRRTLNSYGLNGDFSTVCRLLRVRNLDREPIKGRTIRRMGKAAFKQGKVLDVDKLADYWIVGADLRQLKFDGKKFPVFNVSKAMQFHSVDKN